MHGLWVSAMGGLLLLLLVIDVFTTTLGTGAGPLTSRLTHALWRLALAVDPGRRRHSFLAVAGVTLTMAAIGMWIVLLWLGWALVFSGTAEAVVTSVGRVPAGFWHRLYFTGFTVFTLGTGDYVAHTALWENLMAVAAGTGLFLITLSITYLTPVVQAVTQGRATAARLSSIGTSPQQMLITTWDGYSVKTLQEHLTSILGEISQLEQRHLAYPVLHYFHSTRKQDSLALRVAALDEALTILELGLASRFGISVPSRRIARDTIGQFLGTLQDAFIKPAEEAPALPDLQPLRDAGIPVRSDAEFSTAARQLVHRRRLLRAWVETDGWRWDDVYEPMRAASFTVERRG